MKRLVYVLMLCALLTGCGQKENPQQEISREVLRFHIRAESDKEEDQKLKLKVKTQVVSYLQWLLADCRSKESCMKKIEKNLEQIEAVTDAACRTEGASVKAKVYLAREVFPMKQYGDMIFPGGVYDAIRVDLGKAEGKNWWCMMYPSLCMVDGVIEEVPKNSKKELEHNLSQETYDSLFWTHKMAKEESFLEKLTTEANYHVKWQIIESFQKHFGKK